MTAVIPETGAATVTIDRAAEILGISRTTAYDLLQRDEFPVRTVRIGRRRLVPICHLEAFLVGEGES